MFKFLIFIFSPKFYFLDSVLKELSTNFGYFYEEDNLVEKITKEDFLIKTFNFTLRRNKPFIDIGNEKYFTRYACQYLEEQKLVAITLTGEDEVKYTLTYNGLIIVKSGGLFWSKFWNQLKTSTQYIVWIVAILTFVVNCQNTQKYNKVNNEVYDLKHKIDQHNQQYKQELKKMQLRLEQQLKKESIVLKSKKPR